MLVILEKVFENIGCGHMHHAYTNVHTANTVYEDLNDEALYDLMYWTDAVVIATVIVYPNGDRWYEFA